MRAIVVKVEKYEPPSHDDHYVDPQVTSCQLAGISTGTNIYPLCTCYQLDDKMKETSH